MTPKDQDQDMRCCVTAAVTLVTCRLTYAPTKRAQPRDCAQFLLHSPAIARGGLGGCWQMTGRGINDAGRERFPVPFGRQLSRAHHSMILVAAGASGFLTLIQSGERPDR